MANIRIKRSQGATNAPAVAGELHWLDHEGSVGGGGETTGILYIGDMKGSDGDASAIRSIGGPGWLPPLAAPLASPVMTGTPQVPNITGGSPDSQVSNKKYVDDSINSQLQDMDGITDTTIAAYADAQIMLYDTADNKWHNKAITAGSDVTLSKAGLMTVTQVQAGAVDLGTDTNGNYVSGLSELTGTSNFVIAGAAGVGATPTIALANDVTIANDLEVTRDLAVTRNLTVGGDLTVNGSETKVSTSVVELEDNVFVLGTHTNTQDRGIEFKYNDGSDDKVGFFGYDQSTQKFIATNAMESMTGNIAAGTAIGAVFGTIEGTTLTASAAGGLVGTLAAGPQTGINAVGTIAAGTWNADIISQAKGGIGISSVGTNGVAYTTNGDWAWYNEVPVAAGGTGDNSFTAKGIMYGNGTGALQVTALGVEGQFLKAGATGTPEWSNTVDGGSY